MNKEERTIRFIYGKSVLFTYMRLQSAVSKSALRKAIIVYRVLLHGRSCRLNLYLGKLRFIMKLSASLHSVDVTENVMYELKHKFY